MFCNVEEVDDKHLKMTWTLIICVYLFCEICRPNGFIDKFFVKYLRRRTICYIKLDQHTVLIMRGECINGITAKKRETFW